MAFFLENMSEQEIRKLIAKFGTSSDRLLTVLLSLQRRSRYNYISESVAQVVADAFGMTEAKLYEVLTFYDMLSTKPSARFILEICNSTPCHYEGSGRVAAILEQELHVPIETITDDGMFLYRYCPCMGACDIGPVVRVKDNVYGYLNEARIKRLLEGLRRRAAREDAEAAVGGAL